MMLMIEVMKSSSLAHTGGCAGLEGVNVVMHFIEVHQKQQKKEFKYSSMYLLIVSCLIKSMVLVALVESF